MKKLLIGCLILITACQSANQTSTESVPTAVPQTPTRPATATMTFTPSPTLTLVQPTSVPMYFTEEFNLDMNAWVSFQTGGISTPTITLANDTLQVDISSAHTWYYAIHNSHDYKTVSLRTKFTGAPAGSVGLVCNYDETGWFEFSVASDGTYSILLAEQLGEGIAHYTPLATDSSSHLQPGNLTYEIGLTCQENTLLLYVNDILLRNFDVSQYGRTEGKVGLAVSSFNEIPMTASFDWFRVGQE
jgi:hypothetical protein